MSHEHCVTGTVHTGTPAGTEKVYADRPTYIVGTNKTNALLYLTDVFGYALPNHRLLADTFAEEIPATVYVPDFLEESAFPQDEEARKNIDFSKFTAFNSTEKRFPQMLAYAEALKKEYATVSVVAYCWGAWGAAMLAAKKGLITAVSMNHPSRLDIPGDLEKLTAPTLIVAPFTDKAFPPETRHLAEEIFDRKANEEKIAFKITVYPGFVHGFTARGVTGDEFTTAAVADAKNESVMFFKRFIK
jgi:dienelactone hydrolase